VHLEQTADTLTLVLRGVVDIRPRLELPGVNAEERQLTHEWVGRNLERECRERLVVLRVPLSHFAVCKMSFDSGHILRRRKEVDYGVEHRLHTLVLERGSAEHGNDESTDS